MLMISVVLSACLLIAANRIAYRSKRPTDGMAWLCLGFLLVPPVLHVFALPLAILSVLMIVAVGIWSATDRGPAFFRSLSIGATLLTVGILGDMVWKAEQEFSRLRRLYPYESIETRLPLPKPSAKMTPAALARLDWYEGMGGYNPRRDRLKRLHENAVGLFVDSLGAGSVRMPRGPSEWNLALDGRDGPDVPQPGPRIDPPQSPDEGFGILDDEDSLYRLHMFQICDFVHPPSFGYAKDRRHVAGFVPHRLNREPVDLSENWKVQSFDLIGLLLNDEPRVYVSANLPRMEELRAAPTRPLDKFETVGLAAIQAGDDLLAIRDGEAIRMVGAIRSLTQCVACHGGERGDLLGAFSYVLKRVAKAEADLDIDQIGTPRPALPLKGGG